MTDEAVERKELALRIRIALLVLGVGVAIALVVAGVASFLRTSPATVVATTKQTSAGTQAYLTLQTVGSVGFGARPTWVSYLARDTAGKWVHTTKFQLPANATIHVTVQEYDGQGSLRNGKWTTVEGTQGGAEYVTGKVGTGKFATSAAVSQLNIGDAGHTFTVPALGINVPLAGVSNSLPLCAVAPCTLKSPHNIVKFSFKTHGPNVYRWQCFIPCGLNYLDGNGGPMQTIGYMMGFLQVVR